MTLPQSAHHFADPVAASAYAAYRQAQTDEFSQYVAIDVITHGGVPIFAAGQPVPASTVAAHPWLQPLVRRTDDAPPEPNRGEQLRTRAEELAAELADINRQLSEQDTEDGGPATAYDGLSADELRDELRGRGLPTSGNKPELRARLVEHDEQEGQ